MNAPIVIYTDGGCEPNPGLGGWAGYLIWKDRKKLISGCYEKSTNNRMELVAVIKSLEIVNIKNKNYKVKLYTDSKYVESAINKKWINSWKRNNWMKKNKEIVKNKDLWIRLDGLISKFLDVEFHWVKAHSGIEYNEIVDTECVRIRKEQSKRLIDHEYLKTINKDNE